MNIIPLRAFKDNYIWVIINPNTQRAIVIDPGDAAPVIEFFTHEKFKLAGILITHKHWDHCNGIAEIVQKYPVPVFGPAASEIVKLDHPVKENDAVILDGFGKLFTVMAIPGHTLEHIAYYGEGVLFCGDTLFTGGCGRIFEGTPAQMYQTLNRIAAYPDDTLIYCGHEYTLANLQFARLVEPDNQALIARIEAVEQLRRNHLPTVPATLCQEQATNPFLRCDVPEVIKSVESYAKKTLNDPIEVFAAMRTWKNSF